MKTTAMGSIEKGNHWRFWTKDGKVWQMGRSYCSTGGSLATINLEVKDPEKT